MFRYNSTGSSNTTSMKIQTINAYEILASGGYPTIETEVVLDSGHSGVASVPYGASAGSHEAAVLTDGDLARFHGQGVLHAIEQVTQKIAPVIKSLDPENQAQIDREMIVLDGTDNKSNLGGNAILSVSLAVAKAVAASKRIPLYQHIHEVFDISAPIKMPQPMMVAIEGGKHAHNTTDLQEFCMSGIRNISVRESIRKILESYHSLKKVLQIEGLSTNVGNEGAFAPNGIASNEAPLQYLLRAIEVAGHIPGEDIGISIDAAASEFYEDGMYHLKIENKSLDADELSKYFETWMERYPIVTMEDMFHEDDWDAWASFLPVTKQHNVVLIGDDLTVTNKERLRQALDKRAISGILIKLNQIGTLTETVETCVLAKEHNLLVVPSHRGGGETNDTSMVDLAVAVGGDFIKVGPTRGERVSKFNRLMAIERELGG